MRSEPKFYLKDNKASKRTPIILNLKVNGKPFRYSTQKSIEPELWDKETQKPTKDRKILNEYKKFIPTLKENLKDIENRIVNLNKDTSSFLSDVEQKGEILDFDKLRVFLDSKYKTVITTEIDRSKLTFNKFVDYFINGIESGNILISSGRNFGQKYEPSTIKTWKEWQTQLDLFQKHYKTLHWGDFNMNVYEKTINYFYTKDHSINTVGKFIKNLKAILRRGYRESHHENNIFSNPEFRVLSEDVDNVTLTAEEVKNLSNLEITDEVLDFHRDLFLIGCYTALRISDVLRLRKSHIIENKFIRIWMKKVTDPVVIPISKKLNTILKKYNYHIPKVDRQDYGVNIKNICKDAGITELIEIKSSKGGSITYITKPKHSFIASHTARKTGATLMFLSNIKPLLIMKITGHKKERTFMKYINISQEESARLLANNPYFK